MNLQGLLEFVDSHTLMVCKGKKKMAKSQAVHSRVMITVFIQLSSSALMNTHPVMVDMQKFTTANKNKNDISHS